MASPLTVYSESSDGRVETIASTWASAYGGNSPSADSANAYMGSIYSDPWYLCNHFYINFDTSDIPDDATIDSATLSLYGRDDQSDTDFTLEVYAHNWGDTLETGDWLIPGDFSGLTRVAYKSTSGGISNSAYTDFSSDAAFLTNISKTGFTRLVGTSDRFIATTEPTGRERVRFYVNEDAGKQPKLVVAYTEAAAGNPNYYYAQQ